MNKKDLYSHVLAHVFKHEDSKIKKDQVQKYLKDIETAQSKNAPTETIENNYCKSFLGSVIKMDLFQIIINPKISNVGNYKSYFLNQEDYN